MTHEEEDKHQYKGWLNSDSFWKRVLGVFGYSMVGTAVVWGLVVFAALALGSFFGY